MSLGSVNQPPKDNSDDTPVVTYASHQADIRRAFYSMYIYTGMIEYQSVGDSYVPLLRTVHIDGASNDFVSVRFDKPHYLAQIIPIPFSAPISSSVQNLMPAAIHGSLVPTAICDLPKPATVHGQPKSAVREDGKPAVGGYGKPAGTCSSFLKRAIPPKFSAPVLSPEPAPRMNPLSSPLVPSPPSSPLVPFSSQLSPLVPSSSQSSVLVPPSSALPEHPPGVSAAQAPSCARSSRAPSCDRSARAPSCDRPARVPPRVRAAKAPSKLLPEGKDH